MIFLPGGICGFDAFEEEVTAPMDNCVLKVLECGRCGVEEVLHEVVLKFVDAILTGREGFVDIDGGGFVFDKKKDVGDSLWDVFEGLRGDDVFLSKEVVSHRWKMLFATQASEMRW